MSGSNAHFCMRVAQPVSRREAIAQMGAGFGGLVLGAMFADGFGNSRSFAAEAPRYNLLPKQPHHPPKAKAVIQLFMHGGPSQVDLFDPKPMLDKYDGQPPPGEVVDDEKLTGNLMKAPFKFIQHGA